MKKQFRSTSSFVICPKIPSKINISLYKNKRSLRAVPVSLFQAKIPQQQPRELRGCTARVKGFSAYSPCRRQSCSKD